MGKKKKQSRFFFYSSSSVPRWKRNIYIRKRERERLEASLNGRWMKRKSGRSLEAQPADEALFFPPLGCLPVSVWSPYLAPTAVPVRVSRCCLDASLLVRYVGADVL